VLIPTYTKPTGLPFVGYLRSLRNIFVSTLYIWTSFIRNLRSDRPWREETHISWPAIANVSHQMLPGLKRKEHLSNTR
jgi:hypothetical protein